MSAKPIPLCVDLDGTLIRSDSLLECVLRLAKQAPWKLLLLPFWLLRGRAHFKQQVGAGLEEFDASVLPYHEEFLDWLGQQRERGRELVLCTAADQRVAEAVAAHVGVFSGVLASNGAHNLKGRHKAAALVERYGARGFDYAGNERVDLEVWSQARRAIVVNGAACLAQQAGRAAELEREFHKIPAGIGTWLKALRLHQWVKNFLVPVPMLLAHQLDADSVLLALLAFLSFGLCASSVYVLNDLLDLEADRRHPRKRLRPFASGALPLWQGMLVSPLLLLAAFLLALILPFKFMLVLAFYYAVTLGYSLYFKRVATLDVMLLAGLYTLRLMAGGAATATPVSFWLLAFSMFIFLSLGIIKRYAELDQVKAVRGNAHGRGYVPDDMPLLRVLGVAAGYGAVLVLALYINSPQSLEAYSQPQHLWLLCPLMLYWITRAWMLAHRGQMHDDPVVFALRDPVSLLIGASMGIVVAVAV